jgi:hypothetical protein
MKSKGNYRVKFGQYGTKKFLRYNFARFHTEDMANTFASIQMQIHSVEVQKKTDRKWKTVNIWKRA